MNTRPMLAVAYGTRPQVIKTARLLPALRRRWSVMTIDTGQHYDYELNALLYEQLGVTAPDLVLGVGSGPRDEQLERIQAGCLPLLQAARPRAMVVIGDTNSTLGSALAAARVGIPVVHVEAGLRSHVGAMAEEQNRRQVDALSALLCTPSVAADAWLAAEHLPGRVARTGDVARDVLEFARCAGTIPVALPDWPLAPGEGYLFATLHRAELTNDADRLGGAIETLSRLPLPVVIAVHPRTHHPMTELRMTGLGSPRHAPLGYSALAAVQGARRGHRFRRHPASILAGSACLTLRRETEWWNRFARRQSPVAPDRVREPPGRRHDGAGCATHWSRAVWYRDRGGQIARRSRHRDA